MQEAQEFEWGELPTEETVMMADQETLENLVLKFIVPPGYEFVTGMNSTEAAQLFMEQSMCRCNMCFLMWCSDAYNISAIFKKVETRSA